MSFITRQAAHCDVCGHEWLTKLAPTHCASSKCRSRRWNTHKEIAASKVQNRRLSRSNAQVGQSVAVQALENVKFAEAYRQAMRFHQENYGTPCKECGGLRGLHQRGCKA